MQAFIAFEIEDVLANNIIYKLVQLIVMCVLLIVVCVQLLL